MKLNIQLISIVNCFLYYIVVTMAGDQPKEKSQKEKLQRFRHHIPQLSEGAYPSVCLSVSASMTVSFHPCVSLSASVCVCVFVCVWGVYAVACARARVFVCVCRPGNMSVCLSVCLSLYL